VLDLDETLVHSTLDGCTEPDFSFPVAFNGREHRVHVRRRPHLQPFLERCAQLFEVVVFTASQKVYAEQLLNVLDPHRSPPLFHSDALCCTRLLFLHGLLCEAVLRCTSTDVSVLPCTGVYSSPCCLED
jgi:hypothetical protein